MIRLSVVTFTIVFYASFLDFVKVVVFFGDVAHFTGVNACGGFFVFVEASFAVVGAWFALFGVVERRF